MAFGDQQSIGVSPNTRLQLVKWDLGLHTLVGLVDEWVIREEIAVAAVVGCLDLVVWWAALGGGGLGGSGGGGSLGGRGGARPLGGGRRLVFLHAQGVLFRTAVYHLR